MKQIADDLHHEQQTIDGIDLNFPIKSSAAARPFIGELIEDVALAIFRGDRIRVNSKKVCPDIKLPMDHYAEVKSIGQSGASHLFKIRVEKYDDMLFNNPTTKLRYIYIFHDAKWVEGDTRDSIRAKVIGSIYRVLSIDAYKLHQIVGYLPKKKFNIKGRPELDSGYRLTKNVMNVMWALSEKYGTTGIVLYDKYRLHDPVQCGVIL